MRGHALRGMVTAWLGLIVLQAVGTKGGSGRVASFFSDVDRLVQRALDPSIPAIPDRRTGAATAAGAYTPPAQTVGVGLTSSVIQGGRFVTTGSPYSLDSRPTGPR